MENLPIVDGYKASFNKELDKVFFSNDTDGWNIGYSKSEIKALREKCSDTDCLKLDLMKRHERLIESRKR